MKNSKKCWPVQLLICLAAICVCSCSSEPKYSCDPEIEAWAQANISKYAAATRSEIVTLPMEQQRAIVVGLSAEKKESLWRGKLADILQDPKLSDAEKQEVEKLYNWFIPLFYKGPSAAEAEEARAIEWMDMMKTKYGWNNHQIYYYTFTWLTQPELDAVLLQDSLRILRVSTRSEPGGSSNCHCRYDSDCDDRGRDENCNSTSSVCRITGKCGILSSYPCDGLCEK